MLALARLVEGCTELTAHPRPRAIPLATSKATLLMRIPECVAMTIRYVVVNVTKAMPTRVMRIGRKKKSGVRCAKQNEHADCSHRDQ
jgi:hypothetical protein